MIHRRVAVCFAMLCLVAVAREQARAEPAPVEPAIQRTQDAVVPPIVLEKRAVVLDPQAEVISISAAATILIQNGDLPWLRAVLQGQDMRPALGVVAALGQATPESCEALLPDIVVLAARTTDPDLRKAADGALDNQLKGTTAGALAPPRVRNLLSWLADKQQPAARRVVVMRALGRSGELSYVDPLIEALNGDSAGEARAALALLTGHDLGRDADAAAWGAWWAGHGRYTREQLLELALADRQQAMDTQKAAFDAERAALVAKAVAAKLNTMGESLDALLAGLTDEYADVRLEAARRLASKGNDARATNALPVLLRRLGHAAAGNGTKSAGPSDALPAGDAAEAVESDPRVRAALVTALGVLGRARDEKGAPANGPREDVLAALSAELRAPDAAVTAAAAAALEQFHDQPAVVRPLLDYITGLPADDSPAGIDARVKALQAIAANAPGQVVHELLPFAANNQPEGVRAAGVRAIMACDDVALALDVLGEMYSRDASMDVHFNIAAALGDRLGRPGAAISDELRTRMVALLGNLLEDTEVSVRKEAVSALGRARTDTAFTLLDRRALKETDPTVQARLVNALGVLQKPGGAAVIGTLLSARAGEDRVALLAEAQKALALIAGDRAPAPWLECAEALHAAGAHDAAAWCCREATRRFGDQPELREVVDVARGRLPVELLHSGLAREARDLLLQLESESAAGHDERMLLLADASSKLEDWAAEADYRQRHLGELPEGDGRRAAETLATARALRRANRNAEAVPLLHAHLDAHADDNEALLDLASAEEALGQLEAALHDLERLLDRLPEGDALRAQVQSAHDRVQGLVIQPASPPSGAGGEQQGESVGAASSAGVTAPGVADGVH
ncbi:MAG TPA: HEAT repeat domain-containing protein [Planctomycetota bacterium]|nr:HEAT repeat domain-containing protein [Planctomycetota bacterium]